MTDVKVNKDNIEIKGKDGSTTKITPTSETGKLVTQVLTDIKEKGLPSNDQLNEFGDLLSQLLEEEKNKSGDEKTERIIQQVQNLVEGVQETVNTKNYDETLQKTTQEIIKQGEEMSKLNVKPGEFDDETDSIEVSLRRMVPQIVSLSKSVLRDPAFRELFLALLDVARRNFNENKEVLKDPKQYRYKGGDFGKKIGKDFSGDKNRFEKEEHKEKDVRFENDFSGKKEHKGEYKDTKFTGIQNPPSQYGQQAPPQSGLNQPQTGYVFQSFNQQPLTGFENRESKLGSLNQQPQSGFDNKESKLGFENKESKIGRESQIGFGNIGQGSSSIGIQTPPTTFGKDFDKEKDVRFENDFSGKKEHKGEYKETKFTGIQAPPSHFGQQAPPQSGLNQPQSGYQTLNPQQQSGFESKGQGSSSIGKGQPVPPPSGLYQPQSGYQTLNPQQQSGFDNKESKLGFDNKESKLGFENKESKLGFENKGQGYSSIGKQTPQSTYGKDFDKEEHNRGKPVYNLLREDIKDTSQVGFERTTEEIKDRLDDVEVNLTDEEREELTFKSINALLSVKEKPQYRELFQNFFHIYDEMFSIWDKLSEKSELQEEYDRSTVILRDIKVLIERTCGRSLDIWNGIFQEFQTILNDDKYKQVRDGIEDLVLDNNNKYSTVEEVRTKIDEIQINIKELNNEYGQIFDRMSNEAYAIVDGIANDPQISKLSDDVNKLILEIFTDSNGRPSPTVALESIAKIRDVFFPILTNNLKVLNLPTIYVDTDKYRFTLSDMSLKTKDILPDMLHIETESKMDINFTKNQRDGYFVLKVQIKPINLDVERMFFNFIKKTIIKYKDHGVINLHISDASLYFEFVITLELDKIAKFELRRVETDLGNLQIDIIDVKHDILDRFLTTLFMPMIQSNLAREIDQRLYESINTDICDRINIGLIKAETKRSELLTKESEVYQEKRRRLLEEKQRGHEELKKEQVVKVPPTETELKKGRSNIY